jgi:hypothetical protein
VGAQFPPKRLISVARLYSTGGDRILCASLAQAGQHAEARVALQRLKELQPEISTAWIENYVPYSPGPMAKFVEGMRKAGLE